VGLSFLSRTGTVNATSGAGVSAGPIHVPLRRREEYAIVHRCSTVFGGGSRASSRRVRYPVARLPHVVAGRAPRFRRDRAASAFCRWSGRAARRYAPGSSSCPLNGSPRCPFLSTWRPSGRGTSAGPVEPGSPPRLRGPACWPPGGGPRAAAAGRSCYMGVRRTSTRVLLGGTGGLLAI
jgi:hypothetical protein